MFLIFIAGASASGKSSIAEALLKDLHQDGRTAQILSMDNYFKERPLDDQDAAAYRLKTNFDLPTMLDFPLLESHLNDLSQGKSVVQPIFQFESNRRIGKQEIKPSDFIIIEGIFALCFVKEHFSKYQPSLSIFVTVAFYLELLNRRKIRDVQERNRSSESVTRQERSFVGPGFFSYTAHSASGSDIFIHNDGGLDHTDSIKEIKEAIQEKEAQEDVGLNRVSVR